MPQRDRPSLRVLTLAAGRLGRTIEDGTQAIAIADLGCQACLSGDALEAMRDRSVLILARDALAAALVALDLDGIARRIVLCPPGMDAATLAAIAADAQADALVSERWEPGFAGLGVSQHALESGLRHPLSQTSTVETEWVLLTSGTTGRPKLILHSLASLTGPLTDGLGAQSSAIWSTFYDIRRYGGLQIFLRALLGGGSLVLTGPQEPIGRFLDRAAARRVTHISGTPTHWRRVLMTPERDRIAPRYIRLSGEIADQAILDHLRAAYPMAEVAHAFASTEAGVAFDVRDGLAGFPAAYLDPAEGRAEMRVRNGTLHLRSTRLAARCLSARSSAWTDEEGFIDTGDIVDLQGDRYHFLGRREGTINVGGQKVYPEEVEAILNRQHAIRMSHVWAKPSPITGFLVAADVVVDPAEAGGAADLTMLSQRLIAACRAALPAHKVPVAIKMVESLDVATSGKLVRVHA